MKAFNASRISPTRIAHVTAMSSSTAEAACHERKATPVTGPVAHVQHETPGSFNRFATWARIPEAAEESWGFSTDHPLNAFILFHIMASFSIILVAGQFFWGGLHFGSHTLRRLCKACGGSLTLSNIVLHGASMRYGPSFLTQHLPARILAALSMAVLAAFTVFHMVRPVWSVPFRSPVRYLLHLFVTTTCLTTCGMLTVLTKERGPASTAPWITLLRAGVRAVRIVDAVSDGMLAQKLLEDVRSWLCTVCAARPFALHSSPACGSSVTLRTGCHASSSDKQPAPECTSLAAKQQPKLSHEILWHFAELRLFSKAAYVLLWIVRLTPLTQIPPYFFRQVP